MQLLSKNAIRSAYSQGHMREAAGLAFLMMAGLAGMLVLTPWILSGFPGPKTVKGTIGFLLLGLWFFVIIRVGWQWYSVPVYLKCPGPRCEKSVNSREPWRCGFCGHEHHKVKRWAFSFIGRCKGCGRKADAYECHFCRTILLLTKDEDGRAPARSLHPQPLPIPEPKPDRRQLLAEEIEVGEQTKRIMEIGRDKTKVAIEQARLDKELNRTDPAKLSKEQERINWVAETIADAELTCRTVPETVERELKAHAEIEEKQYHPDPELDGHIKEELKRAVSMAFETVRMGVGANVRIQKKDHSKSGL